MNMKAVGLATFTVLLLCTVGNAQKPKKFKAVQFLQMLNQTFGMQALHDLHVELRKALDLPPFGANPTASSGAPPPPAMPSNAPPTRPPPPPSCSDHPFIEGTTITYFSERRALGTKALIQCDTGYVGSLTQTKCVIKNGKPTWDTQRSWEGCKPVECGRNPPTVINAKPLFTTTTFGALVSYECLNGYKTSAVAANVTCGVNPKVATEGKWSQPGFSCDIKPQLDNNNMMAQFAKMLGGAGGGSGNNNMMAQMMAQMAGGAGNNNNQQSSSNPLLGMLKQMVKQQAPTTTPKPQPAASMPGGMNLPPHLQRILPSAGGGNGAPQISARNLETLRSMGLGAGGNPMLPGGAGMNIGAMISNPSALFGGAGPAASLGGIGGMLGTGMPGMGMPGKGPGGKPLDPEAMQERRQDMMMNQAMMAMMSNMGRNNQKKQQQQGGEGAPKKQQPANPLAAMFPGMQMPGMGGMGGNPLQMMMMKQLMGGGEGKPMGGAGLFGQMNPAALLGTGGGGGGGAGMFGGGLASLFGGGAK